MMYTGLKRYPLSFELFYFCFNYINLQPLHATKNLEKGRKYDPNEKKKLYEQVIVNNINEN